MTDKQTIRVEIRIKTALCTPEKVISIYWTILVFLPEQNWLFKFLLYYCTTWYFWDNVTENVLISQVFFINKKFVEKKFCTVIDRPFFYGSDDVKKLIFTKMQVGRLLSSPSAR